MSKYILEIYESGSTTEVLKEWQSDTPFGAIHVGDVIGADSFAETEQRPSDFPDGWALKVVSIEHRLLGSGRHLQHQLCVYTEVVDVKEAHPDVSKKSTQTVITPAAAKALNRAFGNNRRSL